MTKKVANYKVYSLKDEKECLFVDKKRIRPKCSQVGVKLYDFDFEIGLFKDIKIKKKEYTFDDVYLDYKNHHLNLGLTQCGNNIGAHFEIDYLNRSIVFSHYDEEGKFDGKTFIFTDGTFGVCKFYSHGELISSARIPFKFKNSLIIDLYSGIHLFPGNEIIDYQDEDQYIAGQEGFADKINGFTTIVTDAAQQFVHVVKQFDYRVSFTYFPKERALSLTNYYINPFDVDVTFSIETGNIVLTYKDEEGDKKVLTFTKQNELILADKKKHDLSLLAENSSSYTFVKGNKFSIFADAIGTLNKRPQFALMRKGKLYIGAKFDHIDAKEGISLINGPAVIWQDKDNFEITFYENDEDGCIVYGKKNRVTIQGSNGVISIGYKNKDNQWDGCVYSLAKDCYITAIRYEKDTFKGEYIDNHSINFDIFPHFNLSFNEPVNFIEGFYDEMPSYYFSTFINKERNGLTCELMNDCWTIGDFKNNKINFGFGSIKNNTRFDALSLDKQNRLITYGVSGGGNFAYINLFNNEGKSVRLTYNGYLTVEVDGEEPFTIKCATQEEIKRRDDDDERIAKTKIKN